MLSHPHLKSFTLLELLIVIGILAVLATVLLTVLNPMDLARRGRDSKRMAELHSLNNAIALLNVNLAGGAFLGNPNTLYISLPANNSDCSDLSLPALPSSWSYHCSNSTNYRNIDGTGWIPINFTLDETIKLLTLPQDPVNSPLNYQYYTYATGGSWELTAQLESSKEIINQATDGGLNPARYEIGSDLTLTPFVSGLVGFWPFNETSGYIAYDASGFNNHGTMYSSSTPTYLISNNTLNLDGVDDYVDCGNGASLNITDKITIGAWVNIGSYTGAYNSIALKGTGGRQYYWLYLYSDSSLRFTILSNGQEASISKSIPSPLNQWNYFVGTYDGNYLRIYRNGVELGNKLYTGLMITTTSSPLLISNPYYWSSFQSFHGLIDEVSIYNRALSSSEIQAIYEASKGNY